MSDTRFPPLLTRRPPLPPRTAAPVLAIPTPMQVTTPILGLIKPEIAGDLNVWGSLLNTNFDAIDSKVLPLTGGTLSGTLTINGSGDGALTVTNGGAEILGGPLSVGNSHPITTDGVVLAGHLAVGRAGQNQGGFVGSWNVVSDGYTGFLIDASGNMVFGDAEPPTGVLTHVRAYMNFDGSMLLPRGGLTIPTNTVVVGRDPQGALEVATKRYVDGRTPTDPPSDGTAYGRRNAAWERVLALTGGTLTGPLYLAFDPALPTEAANRRYVDTKLALAGGNMTGSVVFAANQGIAFQPGVSAIQEVDGAMRILRGAGDQDPTIESNGNTASRTPIITQLSGDARYLQLAGGTMTGPLTLAADPAQDMQAATRRWVNSLVNTMANLFLPLSGGAMTGRLILSSGAPTLPLHAASKEYVDDTVSGVAGISEAPNDGFAYGRMNIGWSPTLPLAGGTMTGLLTLSGDPVNPLHAATRQFVLNALGSYLPLSGGVMTGALRIGNNTASPGLIVNGPAGTATRQIQFQTAGTARWALYPDNAAESGSNAGSNLVLNRYADNGTLLGAALSITRANGATTLGGALTLNDGNAGSISTLNVVNTVAPGGVIMRFTGIGTPANKYFRVLYGNWQIVDDAYANVLLSLGNSGHLCVGPTVSEDGVNFLLVGGPGKLTGSLTAVNLFAAADGSFGLTTSGNARFLQWNASGYFNSFDLTTGNRTWQGQNGTLMSLTAAGALTAMGQANAPTFGGGFNGGGSLRTIGGAHWVNFDWASTGGSFQLAYRVDDVAVHYVCTCNNAQNVTLAAGGGPLGIDLSVTDFGGTVYAFHADTSSDVRLKANIAPSEVDALAVLSEIAVSQFDFRAEARAAVLPGANKQAIRDQGDIRVPIGLLAQQLQQVIPEAVGVVRQTNAALPEDLHTIRDAALLPYLVRAIQQLDARTRTLH